MATASPVQPETLRTLPTDAARQVQWGFADRFDLQMLVQAARAWHADRWRGLWPMAAAIRMNGPTGKPRCWKHSMGRE